MLTALILKLYASKVCLIEVLFKAQKYTFFLICGFFFYQINPHFIIPHRLVEFITELEILPNE